MRKLITAMAIVAIASFAQADITVNLKTTFGVYANGTSYDVILNQGDTALYQLINAGANGAADAPSAAGGGMFGDDSLIGTVSVTGSADPAGDYTGYAFLTGTTIEGSGINGANVFARLYVDSTASAGSLYYDAQIAAIPNVNLAGSPPPTPTAYDFGGAAGLDTATFSTVIPEPATIGLMGIAAAGLFTARRKVRA